MFRNSAGEDPLDQLRFMAEQGFQAGLQSQGIGVLWRCAGHRFAAGCFVAGLSLADPVFEPGSTELREMWRPRLELLLEELQKANASRPGHTGHRNL